MVAALQSLAAHLSGPRYTVAAATSITGYPPHPKHDPAGVRIAS